MAGIFRGTSQFDRLLDKATSHLLLEPDWEAILRICDIIRQGDEKPKIAIASIKKKLANPNPHTCQFALLVLESCVKNCGSPIHDEVATKGFMEELKGIIKSTQHNEAKKKILELIQAWAYAFRNSPKYRAVPDFVTIMKTEGFEFPVLNESDAMFAADTAPVWAEGEHCHRCRTMFSVLQRKHHCRACGQVFCQQCSSKNITLPKFGIEKEVRVCDDCYDKFSKSPTVAAGTGPATGKGGEEMLPAEYLNSSLALQSQAPPPKPAGGKTEEELKEEEELQLALALSQSEAESQKQKLWSPPSSILHHDHPAAPPPSYHHQQQQQHLEHEDLGSNPEMAKYLNRSYWEQKKVEGGNETGGSRGPRPATAPTNNQQFSGHYATDGHYNNQVTSGVISTPDETSDNTELDDFIRALKSQVEIFVNRMKSNSSRGRSIANDSSVQTLFVNITTMHSRLLKYIQQQDDKRVYYEGLQDKLTQVKDARAALDALRDEHNEKLRREAEVAERQKQIQMAHKLDLMRKKKQEYLQYQRSMALAKIQEQEYEMQRRQEQQKQQYYMQNNAGFYEPGIPTGPPGPPPQYSQQPPSYHQAYNMMPQGHPGSEIWAPDSKPMMNPAMLPMGPQSMNQGPPSMGPQSMNQGQPSLGPQTMGPPQGPGSMGPQSMNQGPQSMNQGHPSIGPQGPPLGQMGPIRPLQPNMGPAGMGPNNHAGPMNPNLSMNPPSQMTPSVPMNPGGPGGQMTPGGPMNPPHPHPSLMAQQPSFQPQPMSNTNPSLSNHSMQSQSEVKPEDNTAELISFD
uniref:Hepatocyte growth factor-regulated tyrosine kinase substrate n=1 Tax=Cacopsylla melanoneura TaxID=428564 RepID=A0A8D8S8Y9_9HEMI